MRPDQIIRLSEGDEAHLFSSGSACFGAMSLPMEEMASVGETMAVAMLIGNAEVFNWSLFSPGTTLAALLANHFAEANQVEIGALMYAALVLLAITLVINIIGEFMLNRASEALGGLQK